MPWAVSSLSKERAGSNEVGHSDASGCVEFPSATTGGPIAWSNVSWLNRKLQSSDSKDSGVIGSPKREAALYRFWYPRGSAGLKRQALSAAKQRSQSPSVESFLHRTLAVWQASQELRKRVDIAAADGPNQRGKAGREKTKEGLIQYGSLG